ncbi:MAG: TonB-dependent receptor [Caulobacteraceae bacterium]|nr:TonB-dependent receptor [Caulobacteraceae bacterium]
MLCGATALSTLAWANGAAAAEGPAAAGAGVGSAAAGDAAVEEIVVTARHRSEDSQKVPAALAVVGGQFLARTNTTNIAQVAQFVPSMQFSFVNARNANINIRGLGNNIGLASDGIDPGVGFYVDQVYYDRPATATFDLVDIDHVEVLRGPQGTLFGKNSTAGAIAITTSSPTTTPKATAEISGGNYGYFQAKASISGPIVGDILSARLSVATTTREGLLTNVGDGGNRVNAYRNQTYRGQILYTPTADFKLRVIADYSKQDTNCCDLVLAGIVTPPNGKNFVAYAEHFGYTPVVNPFSRQADTNSQIQARQETGGISAEADWSLPKATLTSITAWRFWNWWPANDSDYTPLSILTRSQNGDYQNQFSQEFRIASSGSNLIDYVGGLYFFREQINAVGEQQYGNAATYFLLSPALPSLVANGYTLNYTGSFDTTSVAAFGQATWHVTSRLNLTGGLRYTYDHKDGRFNQVASGGTPLTGVLAGYAKYRAALGSSTAFSVTDNKGDLSGLANVSYQVTDDVLGYVNYARGYKSGGLNLTQLPTGVNPVVAPESIDSVEAGLKTRLFDRRVTLNADVFWEKDENYQANIYDTTYAKQYLSNVPEVRSEGVEVDVQAQPTEHLSLYGSGTWDDAVYAKYPKAPCGLEKITQGVCNLSGAALAGVPRWSASAGGEYDYPLALGARETEAYVGVDYTFRSSVYSSATDSIYSKLPSLSLVNARLGVRAADQRWDAYLWAKNLGNVKYFTFISAGAGNTGQLVAQLGDPQTWGATLRVHY